MPALLGGGNYTTSQASYDLTRLRAKGLIERLPGRNVYRLTPTGQRFAVFYTKLHNRLLRPLMAADRSPAPLELRQALHTIDRHIDDYLDLAGVCPA
jgi:DNA-binding MarR family transcriptional regulator